MRREGLTRRDGKGWRRMRAWGLERRDWNQRDIAEALGVTESAVSPWMAMAHRDGPMALRAHPAPGRRPRLAPDPQRLIPEFLRHEDHLARVTRT